jgi:hypothetical protein
MVESGTEDEVKNVTLEVSDSFFNMSYKKRAE